MSALSSRTLPFISGSIMSINFLLFWAVPIMGMGSIYKHLLKPFLQPIYLALEQSKALRSFAAAHIYTKPEHADFFVMSALVLLNCMISISYVFYYQLVYGHLPAWLIAAYYCSWVGLGGSIMGSAYGLAHKEGHYYGLYQKWLRVYVGHFFENCVGVFFGNVPWNFTTSHVYLHHRLDGGFGDSFYEWDLDRSSLSDFMLYVHRVLFHMVGYSSLKLLPKSKADQLREGIRTYLLTLIGILAVTRSFAFCFWIIIEPLLCMTYFLALINIGFHGFVEFDSAGQHVQCVNSSTIIEGEDDLFGEDDHMAHHYNTSVYYRDLIALQKSKEQQFAATRASVFRGLSIVELSIFIVLGLWDKLADHYVDYTGQMSRQQVKDLLKARAQRTETSYERYQKFLRDPSEEARRLLQEESMRARCDCSVAASSVPHTDTADTAEVCTAPTETKAAATEVSAAAAQ
ncbi:hypothetical protein B484DRAFT_447444 [Ochromonadaceae sp. CCMP2298]|nr:hypothetical protein B484DRAFT_447444 [Ochromonadaceae sp. CCMP2298]|mmetsp:Transcript_10553/g.23436  ORF Transcript_10553/g.23436 Transcript_10553/m.23436 type:complete len:458 (+) Transcript_10553:90-1463(+)